MTPQSTILIEVFGVPLEVEYFFNNSKPYSPWMSFPKTTWAPSNQGQGTKVKKNWEPLVFGPALAIDKSPG